MINLCDIPILCKGGGAECKELNANHTNIKAVNKFQYTGKDGSVKWPYIAVCRKFTTRKAVITKLSHAVNHKLYHV